MSGTITRWLDRFRDGDSSAVDRLWKYFSPRMLRRVAPQCRQLRAYDEEDIVSSAFYNLTSAMAENRTEPITNRKEFWRLLRIITKRRLRDSIRHETAQCRGGGHRVVSLQHVPDDALPSSANFDRNQISNDSPDILLARLKDVAARMHRPEFKKIIELKVKGLSNIQVARELGVSLRTTQYLISEIKTTWRQTFE